MGNAGLLTTLFTEKLYLASIHSTFGLDDATLFLLISGLNVLLNKVYTLNDDLAFLGGYLKHLTDLGVRILGTSAADVDAAEDRELFDKILEETQIPRAAGGTVYTAEEAKEVANRLGYPVLVRPSYVLGGQGMQIAISDEEIEIFMEIINRIAQDHPILVDKYSISVQQPPI